MNLALIGNCAYQALIDDTGRVRWLCWPRFDSSFVFGSLLDEQGGEFAVETVEDDVRHEQAYVPNTNILRTVHHTHRGSFDVTDFAPRFRQYERSFKPTMLVRRLRKITGEPLVRVRCRPTYEYGRATLQPCMASNHIQWTIAGASSLRLTTNIPLSYVADEREFLLENEAWIVLTYGEPLEAPLVETCETFLAKTQKYWERWVKHTTLPGRFQEAVVRSALALKLHQFEDTGAITAATTTSLPEFLGSGRNWDYRFCWLRDAYFTLRAMFRIGHFDELEAFASFLKNLAVRDAELQPVYGIAGERQIDEVVLDHLAGYKGSGPVRAGNAAYQQVQYDCYGEMLAALAPFFMDLRFQTRSDGPPLALVERLLRHIEQTMDSPDAGIWEIRDDNRVHTFSLLFHWVGGAIARQIARHLGDAELAGRGDKVMRQSSAVLDQKCWVAEGGFFGDSTTTSHPDAAALMMINLGYLAPDDPRAESHLRALADALLIDGHLMRRYKHHDGLGNVHPAAFTVCGFWYVEALARLGHTDEASAAFERLLSYRNHVGLLSEDVSPQTGEQLGNFPQTYSHVGIINAAFSISPLPEDLVMPGR
ncbi:MAG: glycoside hydrolase family 15 protein [Myxococcales bacterium FL481]|nr:MAG: glycoside hydrolase family 15 protein [Myxococcales bacterium FL481]